VGVETTRVGVEVLEREVGVNVRVGVEAAGNGVEVSTGTAVGVSVGDESVASLAEGAALVGDGVSIKALSVATVVGRVGI
jgi:hypothetical protein